MKSAVLVAFVGSLTGCGFTMSLSDDNGGLPVVIDARTGDASTDASTTDAAPSDATPPVDAAPDAMPTWVDLETLVVDCTGTEVTSTTVLAAGTTYRVRASGQCTANDFNNSAADAEYIGYNLTVPTDVYMNVDTGLAINDTTRGPSKLPDWGAYTSTHVYEAMWTGLGAAIVVQYHEEDWTNNAGSLTVRIQAFQ